jgi:hypothetical protein
MRLLVRQQAGQTTRVVQWWFNIFPDNDLCVHVACVQLNFLGLPCLAQSCLDSRYSLVLLPVVSVAWIARSPSTLLSWPCKYRLPREARSSIHPTVPIERRVTRRPPASLPIFAMVLPSESFFVDKKASAFR